MIVVDASVVIAALLPEPHQPRARDLLADEACIAPDLLINECVNAVWKNVRTGNILDEEGRIAVSILGSARIGLESSAPLAERALALSLALDHAAYDCFYLALAEEREVAIVTLDGRLARKVWESRACRAPVRLLGDTTP